MIRGTTPVLILNIEGEFSWSEVTSLQVTIRDSVRALTYTKGHVTWDGENNRLLIQMSQSDTLALGKDCQVQLRYQISNGNAFATNIATIKLGKSISSNVIGDDVVKVSMHTAEADVAIQSNDDEVSISVEHGEVVEGDPRIYDISKNGDILPINDGVVNIVVPVNVEDLTDGEELTEAVSGLQSGVSDLEDDLAQVQSDLNGKASQTAVTTLSGQVTEHGSQIQDLGQAIDQMTEDLADKADSSDVYTKDQADATFLKEHQDLKTINNQSIVGTGNLTIEGMTDDQKAKLAEVDSKANSADVYTKSEVYTKSDVYTKTESDGKYLTEHQQLKTINGESIEGSGDIEVGSGDVQSVSVNGGTPVQPDDNGNINLTIEEGGAKRISDLSDGSRVGTLETKVDTLEQESSKFSTTLSSPLVDNTIYRGTFTLASALSLPSDNTRGIIIDKATIQSGFSFVGDYVGKAPSAGKIYTISVLNNIWSFNEVKSQS